ncbi:5-oxoprolinase (ATP-hydrolysing) [Capronia epimyces CBS 606.96]|uniref:5-oxoprolinase (ATP-hydrolysing) n=1 Tax=Capronia epimyces CBS 606.96 TaxID=1182542 RepID=W9ZBV0_9EURO|nr:5-oxoprolinase (ATP-hydrolyzing) [Capronia epimyces CBS 606.96]EXJ91984.1 5-oxoprolinase (ATP-hydrolysing) [Capronia epimyces CBS 606.96]
MSPHKVEAEAVVDGLKSGASASPSISKIDPDPSCLDRGGTFTDCLGMVEGRDDDIVVKLLSQDPGNYADAPIEGIRRILEKATGTTIPRNRKLDTAEFADFSVRMGTTVATNALLERKGERVALLITKGFKDALVIGNQSRPKLFALNIERPGVLFEDVVEVDERVTIEDYQQNPLPDPERLSRALETDPDLTTGVSGDVVRILTRLDEAKVRTDLQMLFDKGYRSLAVCLTHSYTFQDHELAIEKIARDIGFPQISLSSQLLPMIKMTSRGTSATVDAYLTPVIKQYIQGFRSGFKDELKSDESRCEFMQSDGGLVNFEKFSGLRAILSGPAGGVVGCARTSYDPEDRTPVIGFDMGGTSTDVSRFDGTFDHTFENTTAGVTVMAPQLDINTVAAGGGSILFWRHGLFVVGPDSAGAHPGPACYRKGGPLTVTDANLFLGRLLPQYFPQIFGPHENEGLDVEITRQKFHALASQINQESGQTKTPEEIALGFLEVANESMAKPIRALTQARGFDTSAHNLACFGGAGGQHACAIAASLGIRTVIIHRYSSILSAYGMALADVVHEVQEPASGVLDAAAMPKVEARIAELKKKVNHELTSDGIPPDQIQHEVYLNLRYQGTDNYLMILEPEDRDFKAAFMRDHQREFTFTFANRNILVEDIRVRGVGRSASSSTWSESPHAELKSIRAFNVGAEAQDDTATVYFSQTGHVATPVFFLGNLKPGSLIHGPAMIIDQTQTIVVEPEATATIISRHVILNVASRKAQAVDQSAVGVDPIRLSIFGHRFMSVAEQMGRMFQKTSVSTNIKERLDFSCALFSPDGKLVANAPHVPVHLGSMEYAVRYQHARWAGNLKPGDHILTNHPLAGGTHLPDITIITPVWDEAGQKIIFYVASRGHHAEIGGTRPGSMPSDSRMLYEEGAMTMGFKVVSGGQFDEATVRKFLCDEPAAYPNCSGTRTYNDNVSDLKAAIAANQKGAQLIGVLIDEYTLPVVHFYMDAIKANAEVAVRRFLQQVGRDTGGKPLRFSDFVDDGTEIRLEIRIDAATGGAAFDFTGTGRETFNCLNAPKAIAHSAIIYCLRALINVDIPLNQGCLAPIDVIIPEGTLLNPSGYAAVCAGNPTTSQRITDVILGAFGACAASQGDCNIISFGMGGKDVHGNEIPGFGVGETICGGSGAGPSWHGTSGVHVHMTNTRITDPEVYELRYPIILRQFAIRPDSGGRGLYHGGNGVVRELEFRIPLSVSMLSERRVYRPYGMAGGEPGAAGLNLYVKKELDGTERIINIGGKMELSAQPGERILIHTPGGGGWGRPSDQSSLDISHSQSAVPDNLRFQPRGSVYTWTMAAESAQ